MSATRCTCSRVGDVGAVFRVDPTCPASAIHDKHDDR